MSEYSFFNGLEEYIQVNEQLLGKELSAAAQDREDSYLTTVNTYLAEYNGYIRQMNVANRVAADFEILASIYKDYKGGKLSKKEFHSEKKQCLSQWRYNIEDQLYNETVFESGGSGQYLRMLEGFGVLAPRADLDSLDEATPTT